MYKFIHTFIEIDIEIHLDFVCLTTHLCQYLTSTDSSQTFRLLTHLIDSLATRVFLSHDELSCIQLSLQMDSFLEQLIQKKHFTLIGYLILDIVLRNLLIQIDFIESQQISKINKNSQIKKRSTTIIVNNLLMKNQFFLSSFVNSRVEISIEFFIRFLENLVNNEISLDDKDELLLKMIVKCCVSRIIYMFTLNLVRKLDKFDSIVKLDFFEVKYAFEKTGA